MSELAKTSERTLEMVAAEIRVLEGSMLSSAIEIGRRMVEAKEMLPHGEFGDWIENNTDFSRSKANDYMRLFREYGNMQGSLFGAEIANVQTFGKLSISKALALLSIPDDGEREDFVENHNVDAMSTRELKAAIKERDEAKAALEKANAENEKLQNYVKEAGDDLAAAQKKVEALENRPVEVAIQEPDPEEIRLRVEAAMLENEAQHRAELEKLKKKLDKAEKAAKEADKAKTAAEERARNAETEAQKGTDSTKAASNNDRAEIEKLQSEVKSLTKKLAMSDEAITTFKVHFENWQREHTAMVNALAQISDETAAKLRSAIEVQIANWRDKHEL